MTWILMSIGLVAVVFFVWALCCAARWADDEAQAALKQMKEDEGRS